MALPDFAGHPLILASASPRRREILTTLGIPFTVVPAAKERPIDRALPLGEAVLLTAKSKAEDVARRFPDRLVLGADTVVAVPEREGEAVLGKPRSPEEAAAMLRRLSGRTHRVLTGVYLCAPGGGDGFTEEARVTFCPMSEAEIAAYIATGEPLDKAGAYGAQGLGARYVARIEGDFFTVMGLPACALWHFLANFRER